MSEAFQAYCFKCKTQRAIENAQPVFLSNGSPATQGQCGVCGSKLTRMGSTAAHEGMQRPEVTVTRKAATRKSAGKKAATRKTAKSTTSSAGKSASAKAKGSARSNGRKAAANSAASSRPLANVGKLVIVESPAKARSVGQYLGKGYTVKASKGHVRDLLVSQISVDVANDFEPKYRVMNDKRDVVKDLQRAVEGAQEVYLATDPDREGEAIAWHLIAATEMNAQKPVRRVVFHEITKPAVQEAFSHPRDVNMNLVNAQQARRILDRLVGYNVTELLWEKVRNRLSAGRVQSIAVRIIVDREREIEAFVSEEYWTLDARLSKKGQNGSARPFLARLEQISGKNVSFGKEGDVTPHLDILKRSQYIVTDVKHGERQRKPSAPFTTSTLQQEASRRLGFNARRTMSIAQQLYEGIDLGREGSTGLITYMRTDSLSVSPQAQKEARDYVRDRFGAAFIPSRAPMYKTRAKGAQEAHEAIRPTSVLRAPEKVRSLLTTEQFKLYNLIWQRFVASQMSNAIYNTLRVDIGAGLSTTDQPYMFRVSGSTIKFAGFLALYEDARDEDTALDEDDGRILPEMTVGEGLNLLELLPDQHFTQPPPRYTEASLVRTLEEFGIGRPSTYAPTVAVIQDREYVVKSKDKRLIPTETGKIVNDLLVNNFPEVMDYRFTARMEDQLDTIAEGELDWRPMLAEFYFPFERQLKRAKDVLPSLQQEEPIGRDCPLCGNQLVIKYGRFGKFIGCSNYPTCRHTEPLFERIGVPCPTCSKEHGGEIIVRRTRKGKTFFGCIRYPQCDYTSWKKPLAAPCPHCGGQLVEQSRFTARCTNCNKTTKISQLVDASEPA